jgi:HAD superfamily hydrolase (TIGR01509 family)
MTSALNYLQDKRGLIFDMDGVLFHSAPAHAEAYRRALATVGIDDVDYRVLAGQRTDEAVRREFARHGLPMAEDVVERVVSTKRRSARQLLRQSPPIVPECFEVLSDLRLRCSLALASSSSRANVQIFLEASRTAPLFDVVLTGDDVAAAKPDPAIFRAARERLGLAPKEALVVEDAASGIEAANGAGIDVLAVSGTLDRRTLAAQRVLGVIDRLSEIHPRSDQVCTRAEALRLGRGPIDPESWTAIIPAAGRGSRLGFNQPKILLPILGRPILDWLVDLLEAWCGRFVFVLSPSGRSEVEPLVLQRLGRRATIVVQEQPTGMGDAVLLAERAVASPHCCVIWGDQILLSPQTVRTCLAVHQSQPGAGLTMPTVVKQHPYIHFVRDAADRIVGVQQAREKEIRLPFGENDCGFFAFDRQRLFECLHAVNRWQTGLGKVTKEFNLLQVIPQIQEAAKITRTIRIDDENETQGINTREEAETASRILARRDNRPADRYKKAG